MDVTAGHNTGRARLVVFTDLDGTLLDADTYSFAPARDTLELLERLGVPVVACTSKTRAEILHYRKLLGNTHPFVSENGGGVYVPEGYFRGGVPGADLRDGYYVAEIGAEYKKLRRALLSLRDSGLDIRGFGDMSTAEVAALTGLTAEEAAMAKRREFDEPFVLGKGGPDEDEVERRLRDMGLHMTRGRLLHIMGESDKGRALRLLAGLYRHEYGELATCALGDGKNDLPMLEAADYAFAVRRPDGTHDRALAGGHIVKTDGVGPSGWVEAVTGLLQSLGLA